MNGPVVIVEDLQLGKVTIKRGNIFCSDAPERADFEDVA